MLSADEPLSADESAKRDHPPRLVELPKAFGESYRGVPMHVLRYFAGVVSDAPKERFVDRLGGEVETPTRGLVLTRHACGEVASSPRGVSVIASARLDEPQELAERLGVSTRLTTASLILAAYERWGHSFPESLRGDFAIVIWDPERQLLLATVDPISIGQLFLTRIPNGSSPSEPAWGFSTHLTPLRALLGRDLRFDEATLARYIIGLPNLPDRTSFREVRRVAGGTTLLIRRGDVSVHRHWSAFDLPSISFKTREEWQEAYRFALVRAVSRRLGQHQKIALALSSGLDSSSLLGLAHQLGASDRIQPVTAVPPLGEVDESPGVRRICEQTNHAPYFIPPETSLQGLELAGTAAGEPNFIDLFPTAVAVARAVPQLGATCLLTGSLGDVVSGGTAYVLSSLLRSGQLAPFVRELRSTRNAPRALLGAIARAIPPADAFRRRAKAARWAQSRFRTGCLYDHAIERLGMSEAMADAVREEDRGFSDTDYGRRHYFAAGLTFETDVQGRLGDLLGYEVVHPFGDRDLLEVSLSFPVQHIRIQGVSRHPLRHVHRDLFTESIRPRKVFYDAVYEEMYPRLAPHLATEALAPPLDDLVSASRVRASVSRGRWDVQEGLHLWRSLAVNAWIKSNSPTIP